MDLPDSVLALDGNTLLPTVLKEDVEAVQICGGPAGLEAELQQLKDLSRVNHEMLIQTEEQLQKEATEDAQFRNQFGTRWTRPQSSTLTKNLQDRLNRFAANLKQAAESDALIDRSVREHSALMSILDSRPIESALPSLSRPIMSLDASEDSIVGALKQSLRQLDTLGAQRAGLEDMLKEMKRKDNILPKLMATAGSHEDLFRKEISKCDHICEEIAKNLGDQEQILMHIQAQNDEFAAIFNFEDYKGKIISSLSYSSFWVHTPANIFGFSTSSLPDDPIFDLSVSREKTYKQIEAAIAKYREIKENINDGIVSREME
ncbi:bck1-like resistance to osmotic shock, variant 2 [Salvia divinorum]|uniref:Bck1-like resistance to osmotic shock, variant 2 n=1 Tax=Salvia divinorum TaxID=28513 RepID=A0ABD1HB12_SALDI